MGARLQTIKDLYSSAPLERFVCLPSAQNGYGGGLYVRDGGVANLDGCTVFSNEAYVRPPYAPSLSLLQRPAGTLRGARFLHADGRRALGLWHGDADQLKHLLKRGLRECWQFLNQTRLQRPAGTLHMTCTCVLAFLHSIMAVGST